MKKSMFLTSLVAASVLFTACGGGGDDGGGGGGDETPTGTKPVFTSPDSYKVVAGQKKAVTLTVGENVIDPNDVFEFVITDKSQAPDTRIDSKWGVIKYTAPAGDSPVSITVTAKRLEGGAVSDPMTITFTPVDPATITEAKKPVKTGAAADSNSSGIERTFLRDGTTLLNVKGPTGLIWADHDDTLNDKRAVSYLDADDYCNGLGTMGGGWRMPNKDELLNLIDYSKPPYKADGDTVINPAMITQNTNKNGFENSLVNVWATQEFGKYIYIGENAASMNYTSADNVIPVRCVKGPEASREHLIHSDIYNYTYDETTKLEWSPASSNTMSTAEAITYCSDLESPHDGVAHTDFRLPSINELRSIVENGTMSDYITNGNRLIISSTPFVDENSSIDAGVFWRIVLREDGTPIIGATAENAHQISCVRDMD